VLANAAGRLVASASIRIQLEEFSDTGTAEELYARIYQALINNRALDAPLSYTRGRRKDLRLLPAFLISVLRTFSRSSRSSENCSVSSLHLRCNAAIQTCL